VMLDVRGYSWTRRENSTSRSMAQVPGSESASSPGPHVRLAYMAR
jgi:hypothetical protein